MAWWGTLLGGTLGYMFGGPLGAMLGAALGRNFDKGINLSDQFDTGNQERVQAAFFSATFSVMGHIAKADGKVTADEISSASHIMAQMQLNAEQKRAAQKLFSEGKKDNFPLDEILQQFKQECHRRRNLLQMFLEIQISTALADGELHASERDLLFRIGAALGFSSENIEHLLRFSTGSAHSPQHKTQTLDDAYGILGIAASATDSEVKKAYRRLMSQHHPDKLVSKGLPEEMIKLATEKTQEIRKAYDLVRENRK